MSRFDDEPLAPPYVPPPSDAPVKQLRDLSMGHANAGFASTPCSIRDHFCDV